MGGGGGADGEWCDGGGRGGVGGGRGSVGWIAHVCERDMARNRMEESDWIEEEG